MSNYDEICSLLTNKPISKKQVTIGASVRLPVQLLAEVTAMANRANVSRNEMMSKLLAIAVKSSFEALAGAGDIEALSDIEHQAGCLADMYWENIQPEDEEEE